MTDLMVQERQVEILRRLRQDGRVVAATLASLFGVSEDTIRRDLRDMATAGLCERVYGGALAIGPGRTTLKHRIGVAAERKKALAVAAVSLVPAQCLVYFDAGSTNLAIAEALPEDLAVAAATNSPAIALALQEKPLAEVILIGGSLDRVAGGSVGARAIEAMAQIRPDLCFIGTCGIDPDGALSAFGLEDAAFKQFVAARSRKVAVAATREKFEVSAPYAVAAADQYHCLLTEPDVDPVRLRPVRDAGCEIILAGM
ncbi:DeoR/GlpR family DNA-binding transcription regulator [Rhizobium straminoryzae]|uniref:DeoR/GlpR transcriptional regulator n=1 Tax=Rhizobium straminoryzae TaxID=1387186 RepID=A0A549T596_9HYPH|nr:DeoR/GlpR family DNA-binding transcription regulator [Rhizobium straminoryzae]TRL37046.1 DeoR/GlpR transcriptional regulator [Rhizobium straminoryzae]